MSESSSPKKKCYACTVEFLGSECVKCPLTSFFSESNLCDLMTLSDEIGSIGALRKTVGNFPEAEREDWVARNLNRIYRSVEVLEKIENEPVLDRVAMAVYSTCKAKEEKQELQAMAGSGSIESLPLKGTVEHLEMSQLAFEAAELNLKSFEVNKKLELMKLNAAIAAASEEVENAHKAITGANKHVREVECDALAADRGVIDAKVCHGAMKEELEKLVVDE